MNAKKVLARFLIVTLIASFSSFGFLTKVPVAHAAACSVTTTSAIDQAYIDGNNCSTIDISGTITVTWTGTTDLVGDGTVTVSSGTVTFSGAVVLGATDDFVISLGATVTHAQGNTVGVSITANDVTIAGTIDANTKGCLGGVASENGQGPDGATGGCGPGLTGYGYFVSVGAGGGGGAGAGYGGAGSKGNAGAGSNSATYGDSLVPTFLGSGGSMPNASGGHGGAGGGKVYLNLSGTLTDSGTIRANGETGAGDGGGGSGGSVYIIANIIAGAGTVTAAGGNGGSNACCGNSDGGGGGGRVAVYYNTNSGFTLANITAAKGLSSNSATYNGVAGTTFILNQSLDDLTVTSGLDFNSTSDYTRHDITVNTGALLSCGTFDTLNIGSTGTLAMTGATWDCSTVGVVNITASNDFTFTNMTYIGGNAGTTSASGGLLTVNGAVSMSLVNSTITSNFSGSNLVNFSLDGTSVLSANAKGCLGGTVANGTGPDATTKICGAGLTGSGIGGSSGGGYGGAGSRSSGGGSNSATYGDLTAPTFFGSGGGGTSSSSNGGAGGGKIYLNLSGTLTDAGIIRANGAAGASTGGGGSGGSVYIIASAIAGAGTITAAGGNGGSGSCCGNSDGGGGGGRVAVYYTTNSSFTISNITAAKGNSSSSATYDGVVGSAYSLQYTVPVTPSITTPATGIYNVSINPSIASATFSDNGSGHVSSDWKVTSDLGGNTIVWSKTGDASNLTSIVVNAANGTFASGTALANYTVYYVFVRHNNAVGASSWSSAIPFTTIAATNTSTQTWDFGTPSDYTFNSLYATVASGLGQLVDLGAGTYSSSAPTSLSAWTKRKLITVTEASGSTLTNFQTKVVVTYDSDMQADFDDIRFTDSDGSTLLNDWLESKTDSTTATFQVKIPTLTASSANTIYMYYGNAGAASASNGTNTFPTFDDFDDGDYTGWTITREGGGAGTVTITSGQAVLAGGGTPMFHFIKDSPTDLQNFVFETDVKVTDVSGNNQMQLGQSFRVTDTSNLYTTGMDLWEGADTVVFGKRVSGSWTQVTNAVFASVSGTTYKYTTSVNGTAIKFYINDVQKISTTDSSVTVAGKIGFNMDFGSSGATDTVVLDNVRIRQFASTEPSVSTGAEVSLATYDQVSIVNVAATAPTALGFGTFTETRGITGGQGSTYYNLSLDGTNWKYWNGTIWTTASTGNYNSATVVNNFLPQFSTDIGIGNLYFKAFLLGNNQPVEIDSIALTYKPLTVTIVITDSGGYTNDSTPVITATPTGATPTDIAFSCDAGSNWSSWITYPDDNVLNDDDGTVFDITNGATGCTATNELKTISAKIKYGAAVSSPATDTTTYDTVGPTVVTVSSTTANGTYDVGAVITATVQFLENIVVTGTPQIQLDMDGTDRPANYSSTSTNTASFTYTVVSGDNRTDLDYTGTGALTLNSGTIKDTAGNNAVLTLATVGTAGSLGTNKNINISTNLAPTVASITPVQSATGDGDVTITFIMDDPDDDDILQAQVEYSLDGGGTWADPTLSTTGSETSATHGDPSIDNAVTYQVGQSGAYITSSSGANTVSIVWEAATDISASTSISNAKIRITPYDGMVAGTAGSSANFILDRVSPSALANLGHTDFSSTQAILFWTAATDTNFNHYEIWHGATESEVIARSGSAVEWDNDNDASLATASTIATTINNTDPRNKYFKIFAVDNFGNELTVATYYIGGGQSSGGSSSSSSGSSSSGGGGGGGGSSSSSSDEDEEETESEETAGSTAGEEEEEVVEEEVESDSSDIWEDFDVQPEEGHWSDGYVKYLAEETNIVEVAVSQPTFLDILTSILSTPNASMPRANALEFMLVLAGYSLDTMTINVRSIAFEDVSLDDEQAGFIQFAYEQRLVGGYPDGTFQPERTVNRAEALKLCSYFFEGDWTHPVYGDELLALYGLTENPFTDVDLNAWYAPYLINAYAKGVVSGYGDGTFGPGNDVSYAEFLKIATLMQNIEEAVEMAEELE